MKNNRGFIKLSRKIQDNPMWDDKPFAKGQAWIAMLMWASWEDQDEPHINNGVILKRGQFIRNQRQMADEFGWKRSKVRRFVNTLERTGSIKVEKHYLPDHQPTLKQTTNRPSSRPSPRPSLAVLCTVLSICKYDRYRNIENPESVNRPTPRPSNRPPTDPQTDHQPTLKKKEELKNKEKNIYSAFDIEFEKEFWQTYPLKKGKAKAKIAYRNARRKADKDTILNALKETVRVEGWVKRPREYIKHATTWLHGECWNDEPVPSLNGDAKKVWWGCQKHYDDTRIAANKGESLGNRYCKVPAGENYSGQPINCGTFFTVNGSGKVWDG